MSWLVFARSQAQTHAQGMSCHGFTQLNLWDRALLDSWIVAQLAIAIFT